MHSNARQWHLDQLFVPFKDGYIKAQGVWDYGDKGAPWKFSLETDSMPLKLFQLPLHIDGLADISMLTQGLSGDSVIVSHTLTGHIQVGIRNGMMQLNNKPQQFTLPPVNITSDRGQIHVPLTPLTEENLNAKISGHWDFSQSTDGKLTLSVTEGEAQHQFDLLHPSSNQKTKQLPLTN
ncbi:AsmA family protein [Vibrio sp. PP-XX7]